MRSAEKARDELQNMIISDRQIDVHFSLPKEADLESKACDREKNQVLLNSSLIQSLKGTILVTLRNSQAVIRNEELRDLFSTHGEIKAIRDYRAGST